jgi:hypothetical protein
MFHVSIKPIKLNVIMLNDVILNAAMVKVIILNGVMVIVIMFTVLATIQAGSARKTNQKGSLTTNNLLVVCNNQPWGSLVKEVHGLVLNRFRTDCFIPKFVLLSALQTHHSIFIFVH